MSLRRQVIRLAHRSPELRPALLRRLASTGLANEFFKATDGRWYMGLEDESARMDAGYEDDDWGSSSHEPEMEYYGPFPSEKAARDFRRRNFANPGGSYTDDRGRRPPPSRLVKMRRRLWGASNPAGVG